MIILNPPSRVEQSRLKIPEYQRGHLSLKSGTEVTVCLLRQLGNPQQSLMTELVVSPYQFDSWHSLWRIRAMFYDKPGVVNRLLEALRDVRFNILTEESASIENRHFHSVEIIADGKGYLEEPARLDSTSLPRLLRRLTVLCLRDLVIIGDRPQISIQRLGGLFAAWHRFYGLQREGSVRPLAQRAHMTNGHLEIPQEIISEALLDRAVALTNELSPTLAAITISDTDERLLRVFLPRPNDHYVYTRISHTDEVGALAAMTSRIATRFDILTSLTRVHAQGSRSHFEVLLKPKDASQHPSSETLQANLLEVLSDPSVAHLHLGVSFPTSAAVEGVTEQCPKPHGSPTAARPGEHELARARTRTAKTSELLQDELQELSNLLKRGPEAGNKAELRMVAVLKNLLAAEGVQSARPTIFVSYEFARQDLYDVLDKVAIDMNVELRNGKEPSERPVFRDAIKDRIKRSDKYLGIWTGKASRINPWLLWEYGVAEAFGLASQLLISSALDKSVWSRIKPEAHHVVFTDVEFRNACRRALESLTRTEQNEIERGPEDALIGFA